MLSVLRYVAQSTQLSQRVKLGDELVFRDSGSAFFISGLHTFPFGLHILVGLHA